MAPNEAKATGNRHKSFEEKIHKISHVKLWNGINRERT